MTPFSFPPAHRAHPGASRCRAERAYRAAEGRPLGCLAAARRGPGGSCVPSETPSGRRPRRVCGPRRQPGSCRRGCRPRPPPPPLRRASCAAAAAGVGARPRAGCRTGPTRRLAAGGSDWPRHSRNSPASRRLRRPRPQDSPERPSCRRRHCGPAAGSPRERVSAKPAARTHPTRSNRPPTPARSHPYQRPPPRRRHRPSSRFPPANQRTRTRPLS